jgi:alkyl sulfatase BDS1-like metallo-beta-lactamase superfamily hydrolase
MLFDLFGVQLNGPKADRKHIVINWNFTDTQEVYALALEDSALTYTVNKQAADADASLTLTRDTLNAIVLRRVTISDAIQSGQVKVIGEAAKAGELFSLFDTFNPNFEIVEPKKPSN